MKTFHNLRDKFGRFAKKAKSKSSSKKTNSRVMHIALVLDESGSMNSVQESTQNGYNGYIQEMINSNKGLKTYCTLVRFVSADEIKVPFENQLLSKSQEIHDYHPSGLTPLYDSIAKAIGILESNSKKGEACVLTIFTDGQENASREFSMNTNGQERILSIIKNKVDNYKWMVNYIRCGDISSIKLQASSIGIPASNVVAYTSNTDKNITGIFSTLNDSNTKYRSAFSSTGVTHNIGFFQEENS